MLIIDINLEKSKNTSLIMGILNMTPDSFYDGGYHYDKSPNELISKFDKCDIIDIGFESSRPGAFPLTVEEELARLKSFIPYISNVAPP